MKIEERQIIRVREGRPLPDGFWVAALLGHEDVVVGTGTATERYWIVEVSRPSGEDTPAHERNG